VKYVYVGMKLMFITTSHIGINNVQKVVKFMLFE